MAQEEAKDESIYSVEEGRRQQYKFGKGDIQYVPPKDYPSDNDYKKSEVHGELSLEHVYGYKGATNNARQNLFLRDNKYLIYYIAAVGVVHNIEDGSQSFFAEHNDDINCLTVDPRKGSSLVVTGQKDPKDQPGKGKDYPKLYIWDYKTMKHVLLIDDVCWGTIDRVQWSPVTGILYVICGDKDQTLKAYDIDTLRKGKNKKVLSKDVELMAVPSQNTKKLGFIVRPCKSKEDGVKDELLVYCAQKIQYVSISDDPKKKGKLVTKFRAISTTNLKKDGEKAFICASYLPSGNYLVGSSSGVIYYCVGFNAVKMIKGHKDAVFAMDYNEDNNTLCTGGSGKDKTIKTWNVTDDEKSEILKEAYTSGDVKLQGSDFEMAPRVLIYDPNNKCCYIGSKSNQIITYNLDAKEGTLIVDGHDGQVHSVSCHPTEQIFITGGWDRALKIWNADSKKCIATYEFTKNGDPWDWQRKQEQEANEDKKDLDDERKVVRDDWEIVTSTWSTDGKWFLIGTESSTIAIFEYVSEPKIRLNLIKAFQIPKKNQNSELEGIAKLRLSADNSLLAVAHMDGNLYIFSVEDGCKKLTKWKPAPQRAAPYQVQWGHDSTLVRVFTRDYEVCYFSLDKEKKTLTRVVRLPDPDKYQFIGSPLLAGWETRGILQKEMDGTDINDCARSNDGKFIVAGDDFGHVRLHNFPVVLPEPNKAYSGHAEHVMNVSFTANDQYVISCGGADMSIFQWKLTKNE
jgi:WD40 repeat protein